MTDSRRLPEALDALAARMLEMFSDEKQFHRHLVRVGGSGGETVECVFDKVDVGALKEAVNALKTLAQVEGMLRGDGEEKGCGIVILPEARQEGEG